MFRLIAAFLTLSVVAILAAPFVFRALDEDGRAGRLMQDGQAQSDSGDWVAARLRFEQILTDDPENLHARLGLARALRGGNRFEAAATHLLYIIDRAPEMAGARIEFGEMLFSAGQLAESRKHLDRAVVTEGPLLPRHNALAAAHAAADGQLEDARALARAALSGDPALSSAYATLVSLALKDEDFDAALATLDQAREAGAETLSLGLLRLGIFERTGQIDRIGDALQALGDRYPDTPELRLALARWLVDREPDKTRTARTILETLVRENAEDQARLSKLTGDMVELLGVDGALDVFGTTMNDPDLNGAFENQIAVLETAQGDRAAAIARLEREIADGTRAETRNASRLLLARLLDPVRDADRRVSLARTVLESDAENPSAHLLLGDADLRRGAYNSAIAHLRAALGARPDDAGIILQLARAHALAGSTELAQDRLSKAVQVSDHAPAIALRYAQLLEGRQGRASAAEIIDIALESHPGDRDLLVRRAQLALAAGDVATARVMRNGLKRLDDSADLVAALDMAIAAQSGQIDEMIAMLQGDMTVDGDDDRILSLAAAYLRAGKVDDALALLDDLVRDRPDWVQARLMRADARLAARDFDGAEADLASAADMAPELAKTHADLARLRLSLDRPDDADLAIARGLENHPEDYELGVLRAYRLDMTGDDAAARAAFRELAARMPDDPRVAARLGLLLVAPDSDPEDLAQAAQLTAPFDVASDPERRAIRGWVLYRNGDIARGTALLRDAASALPDDPAVAARLGLAELEAGNAQAGQAALSRALDLAATDRPVSDPRLLETAKAALDAVVSETPSAQSN